MANSKKTDLNGSYLKLKRADYHIDTFDRLFREFFGRPDAYCVRREIEADTGVEIIKQFLAKPLPEMLALIVETRTRSVKVKTTTDEEADGREEPDQTAAKRKGMCCTEGRPPRG